jgi:hypothetical protein
MLHRATLIEEFVVLFLPLAVILMVFPDACRELKINPKITIIVVGKRHHIRSGLFNFV